MPTGLTARMREADATGVETAKVLATINPRSFRVMQHPRV
jgi:hypothetical protein